MPTVGFEPAIPERERLQTHTLDSAAFGISVLIYVYENALSSEILRNVDW